jgi:hypothetical protein
MISNTKSRERAVLKKHYKGRYMEDMKQKTSMIPLKLPGFNNLFLVGDDKQLESVVKSKVCLRYKIIHSFSYFMYLLILYPFCYLLDCKRPWVSKKPLREIGSNWLPKALAKCAI